MTTSSPGSRPSRRALAVSVLAPTLGVVASVAILALGWRLFVGTRRGQLVDGSALAGADFGREAIEGITTPFLRVVSIPFLVIVLLVAVVISLMQRRWSIAVAAVALVAGANLTTQLLKTVLSRPEFPGVVSYGNSWPSGHTTVAASVSAAALLIVPHRWRGATAVAGCVYATLTGWATIIADWHRPSDVIAAYAVASLWYFAVEALRTIPASTALPRGYGGAPTRNAVRTLRVGTALAATFGVGLLAATALTVPVHEDWQLTLAYLGSCCGILAVCALLHWLMLAMRPHHEDLTVSP